MLRFIARGGHSSLGCVAHCKDCKEHRFFFRGFLIPPRWGPLTGLEWATLPSGVGLVTQCSELLLVVWHTTGEIRGLESLCANAGDRMVPDCIEQRTDDTHDGSSQGVCQHHFCKSMINKLVCNSMASLWGARLYLGAGQLLDRLD